MSPLKRENYTKLGKKKSGLNSTNRWLSHYAAPKNIDIKHVFLLGLLSHIDTKAGSILRNNDTIFISPNVQILIRYFKQKKY